MKKSLLLLVAALTTLVASAQTKVEINGIWYNLVSKAKQAEVTFKGDSYYEYDDEYSGSIIIPATVTYEGVNYSVTSIGECAFMYCYSLTSITLPASVTSIGFQAFAFCFSLTSITSHAATPPTIEDSFSFEGVDKSIPVYVPAGSIEAYKAATGWSDFTNYVGIETGIENPEIRNHKSEITYDLNGRRVTDPESRKGGVYIVGGRKVVIK